MKCNILIVDDDKQMLFELSDLLVGQGYVAKAALDGETALSLAREYPFDVALVDLKMPGMSGVELIRLLRELRPDARYIILTAYASLETALSAIQNRVYDYLLKPFSPDELIHIVSSALADAVSVEKEKGRVEDLRKERDTIEEKAQRCEMLNHVLMNREDRIIELKHEVNELLGQLGRGVKYTI
jgi:DNA-binding NtrC family response regulator